LLNYVVLAADSLMKIALCGKLKDGEYLLSGDFSNDDSVGEEELILEKEFILGLDSNSRLSLLIEVMTVFERLVVDDECEQVRERFDKSISLFFIIIKVIVSYKID
jgi:hypothetical protein